ncbi:hypothetical protein [Sphingomonas echinoides]|uniref:hypothetical protein n=1 Tax=Sphingomonas echinoides TaxID=59803 RepID=UPI002412EF95|nr:hypothetical protein [Sphingomonas echinoides]
MAAARNANAIGIEANNAARDANAVSTSTLFWTRAGFAAIIATLFATAWAAWAAAEAARAAKKSLDLFQQAEKGYLVPVVDLLSRGTSAQVSLVNRGRTPVMIYHADLGLLAKAPVKAAPIEAFFTLGKFKKDVLIAGEERYEFGELELRSDTKIVYLVGGAIYRDFFGRSHVARISVCIDLATGRTSVHHATNFDEWDRMAGHTNGKKRGWWRRS